MPPLVGLGMSWRRWVEQGGEVVIGVARVSRVVLLLVVVVGMLPAVALGAGWSVVPSPNPPGGVLELLGVSCASASACTAVGSDYINGTGLRVPLVERWNGTRWAIQASPNLPAGSDSFLSGVSCVSARACTAVGDYGAAHSMGLVERWNGRSWAIQTTPNPPAAPEFTGGFLSGVSCVSASACTAVGSYYNRAGRLLTFAERWDGTDWAIQPTPNPPSAEFGSASGVSCGSASACTAVGDDLLYGAGRRVTFAERWDGARWAIQPTPNLPGSDSGLFGVSCVSAHACTAVGHKGGADHVPLVERWNGTRWAIQATPTPDVHSGNELRGVSCPSATACTAVGDYNGAAHSMTLAERWDGTRWAIQPTPTPDVHFGNELYGVSCPSVTACTAVGPGLIESWTAPSDKFTVSHIKAAADGTMTFSVRVPGRGSVDVLGTAWNHNLARAAVLLKPAPHRFVFARRHVRAARRGTLSVTVTPNQRGRLLAAHHRYRVVLRLWVSYTPDGRTYRTIGFLGLHLPGTCTKHNNVTALKWRTVFRCN